MKSGIYLGGLGLAIVGAGLVFFLAQRTTSDLTAQVTRLTRQNADLRFDLKQTRQQAVGVGQHAIELDSELGSTKARTTAAEARNVQLSRELNETRSLLTGLAQREVTLMAELAALREKVAGGVTSGQPTGPPGPNRVAALAAEELGAYRDRIAQLQEQLMQLLTRALSEPATTPVPEAAPAPHQVVRVGPSDTFVILDYGAAHGARLHAIMRLQRGTSELAQVQISDVRTHFSLAQVVPGTLKGQLQTGDLVVFNP